MTLSNYQTYVGGGPSYGYVQVNTGSTAIEYPTPNIVDVFGPIYTPRLYAKDLTAMEIASSGGVSFALNDARALDIYDTTDATILGAYHSSDTSSNSSYVSFHKNLQKLKLFGRNGIEVGDTTSGNIVMTTATNQYFAVGACNLITLSTSGVYVQGNLTTTQETILLGKNTENETESGKSNVGMRVWGAPVSSSTIGYNDARFIKSFTWNAAANGTMDLGGVLKGGSEAYWEVRGGHLRLSHYKDAIGSRRVSFIMRINDQDELEFVKLTMSNNVQKLNKVIARFGMTPNSIA